MCICKIYYYPARLILKEELNLCNMESKKQMFYEDVFRKLSDKKVKYVVVGGIAMVLHGVVRFTADLDLMVCLEEKNLLNFIFALDEIGYKPKLPVKSKDFADPVKRRLWKNEKNMQVFTFFHPKMPFRLIDVFVDEPIDYDKVDEKKKVVNVQGIKIPLVSMEHLKELKTISARPQDIADIKALEMLENKDG